jgi:hypothetical protein
MILLVSQKDVTPVKIEDQDSCNHLKRLNSIFRIFKLLVDLKVKRR